ncbi:NmrA-like family protein [Colletotrichum graminicola]|uniref:NmrA-like family protein n=1 Tax=Colletotrichum graminicola (strain M1.001 / M2 / FGSC 10212) TaxID=645133 RepID=E3Q846_COLGM|nr:NmrA-like family protein [Colletotrichum graminicola M1.001]EFQ27058.1 NmrA-like family protein [Colletotrichum graminicola M1.001]WDK16806.1 NmrA-like family protein [Colletotrichum graminicola]
MALSHIKNVLVVGASGSVGGPTVKALLEEDFQVTGLTRQSSSATLPEGVRHLTTDFSKESLLEAFRNQDAVVSAVTSSQSDALMLQKNLVDAAIAAGVKVFVPSEYGIDTADGTAPKYVPALAEKIQVVEYLKERQDKISWTAIVTGAIFDWGLKLPGFGGLDVAARTVTIFDGGDIPYDATNLDQVGKAIAKTLKKPKLTRNQHVYVNSFTVTQNKVLSALEKATGDKFVVSQGSVEELWQGGAAQLEQGQPLGILAMIAGALYGKGGLAYFSNTKGLWNERLALPQEDLEEFIGNYIRGKN